jgi:hypothetical protein
VWNAQVGDVPELYPVLLAVANHVYVTPVDVLTLYVHEAIPLVLVDREAHAVGTAPLTVMVTVAPETGLPLLVTLTFSVTVEPFATLALFAGLVSVTVNDFVVVAEVAVTIIWFTCWPTGVAVTWNRKVWRMKASNCSSS